VIVIMPFVKKKCPSLRRSDGALVARALQWVLLFAAGVTAAKVATTAAAVAQNLLPSADPLLETSFARSSRKARQKMLKARQTRWISKLELNDVRHDACENVYLKQIKFG
jgi:hypothetical protein